MDFSWRKKKIRRTKAFRTQSRESRERTKPSGNLRRKFFRGISAARGLFVLFFLALLAGGIFFGAQYLTIQNIRIAREDARLDITNFRAALRGIPGKNLLTFSSSELEKKLEKQFPEIETLEISRLFPNTLHLKIATANPSFWISCQEEKKSLDVSGKIAKETIVKNVALTEAGALLGNVDPSTEMFVLFEKEKCPDFSKPLFPEKRLQEIFEAKAEIEKISGQKIVRAGYFRSAREIHFYLENETAIWLDFMRPLQEQIEEYRIALSLDPDLTKPLDHLDIRIADKIFYAEKEVQK